MTEIYNNNNILPFGAHFTDDGCAVFRLFTFEDTENVILKIKPNNKPIKTFNMNKIKKCIWEIKLSMK